MQAALSSQIEEKHLRKERRADAKRAQDVADRIEVLKVLAHERAATGARETAGIDWVVHRTIR